MITTTEIAWLAGLLEGEGHFGYMQYTPRVDLWMSDRDVIERAAGLVGKSVYTRKIYAKSDRPSKKPLCGFTICGAQAVGVMLTVYAFLGARRRQQIANAITTWRLQKPRWPRVG